MALKEEDKINNVVLGGDVLAETGWLTVLGFYDEATKGVTFHRVRLRYRELSLRYHPDKGNRGHANDVVAPNAIQSTFNNAFECLREAASIRAMHMTDANSPSATEAPTTGQNTTTAPSFREPTEPTSTSSSFWEQRGSSSAATGQTTTGIPGYQLFKCGCGCGDEAHLPPTEVMQQALPGRRLVMWQSNLIKCADCSLCIMVKHTYCNPTGWEKYGEGKWRCPQCK
jgi:hypothetical protein